MSRPDGLGSAEKPPPPAKSTGRRWGAGTGGLWVGVRYSGKAHGLGRGTDGTDTQNQRKLDVSELTETVSNYG